MNTSPGQGRSLGSFTIHSKLIRLSPTGDSKPFSTLYIEKIPFSICSSSVL
jgi:hypothetical protein